MGDLVADPEGGRGIGHLREVAGQVAMVEYFDHPSDGGSILLPADVSDLRRVTLAPQTRVHFEVDGAWWQGRAMEHAPDARQVLVRMTKGREVSLPESRVRVRWRRRLEDASSFLEMRSVESRRYQDGRSSFVRAYLARVAAFQGITGLSSASIELHPHQVEVARRVLTDFSQRYLLADEVGLGKTIEAGIVIRQHLLDRDRRGVVAFVPDALVDQWDRELALKFRVHEQFPGRVQVLPFSSIACLSNGETEAGLLVVDEAHRVAAEASKDRASRERYDTLARLAAGVPKVLLLSATPLLQEKSSLLRLLHLLAPRSHPLEDEAAFAAAMDDRDSIARFHANLDASSPVPFIAAASAGLRELFPADAHFAQILDELDEALNASDPTRIETCVRHARAYLGEAYRVFSRMLRTRRGSGLAADFPVLGRLEPVRDPAATDVALASLVDAWRDSVLAQLEKAECPSTRLLESVRDVLEGAASAGNALGDAAQRRLACGDGVAPSADEEALLRDLIDASATRFDRCPRITRSVDLAAEHASTGHKVAIAVGTEEAAAEIVTRLAATARRVPTFRISSESPDAAERYTQTDGGAIIVLGPSGEEGQNLQATQVLIHADLPWNPNRLEQRLGRFDRFGPGIPARQIVVTEGDAFALSEAWLDCLSDGFRIFESSIASIQFLVDELVPGLVLEAIRGGAVGLRDQSRAVAERMDGELERVELAELLDETTVDDQSLRLSESTEEAESGAVVSEWSRAVEAWAVGSDIRDAAHLRFHSEVDGGQHRFALTPYGTPDPSRITATDLPLVPLDVIAERFAGAFDREGSCTGSFRRITAAHRGIRLFGPGDPFVEALWAFTEEDDRGRSFATWRARSEWPRQEALAFMFDVRVSADIERALELLLDDEPYAEGDDDSARPGIRRRVEAYFPPVLERVWLSAAGREITHAGVLSLLNQPYSELRGDMTIRPTLWSYVDPLVPRDKWRSSCRRARQAAVDGVRLRSELVERGEIASAALLADGRENAARLEARRDADASRRAVRDIAIMEALADGVRSPRAEIDVAGFVVLAAEPIPADELR